MQSSPEQPGPVGPMLRHAEGTILLGRFGLRAGWSMAVFAVLSFLLLLVLSTVRVAVTGELTKATANPHTQIATRQPGRPGAPSQPLEFKPRSAAINEGLTFAAVALATLAMGGIERRRIAVYGLGRARLLDLFAGAFWGVAALSVLVVALRSCHALVFDGQALHGAAIYRYGAEWLLVFLLVGLFEEYSTRGFLQYTLMRGLYGLGERLAPRHAGAAAFWSAAVVMSIVFGLLHLDNPGETPSGILMVFCAGLLFSYALWRTGSLWWAIGFHTTWDWAQSFLYGVPDSGTVSAGRLFLTHPVGRTLLSGGADGPEGSVLVLPTLLLVACIIRFTTRPGSQPPLEPTISGLDVSEEWSS